MSELEKRRLNRLNQEYKALDPEVRRSWWVDVVMLGFGVLIVIGVILWNPMQI